MKISSLFRFQCLSLLLFVGCGEKETATLTVLTGLEKEVPFTNFMNQMSRPESFSAAATAVCVQTQVFAAYGIQKAQKKTTQNLVTFPLSLSTPITNGSPGSIHGYSFGGRTDAAAWLQASTLSPIRITVPLRTPIEFGIGGALVSPSGANSDGTCSLIDTTGNPNASFSMLGHTQATLTDDTSVPLRVWVSDAQPPSGDTHFLPVNPGGVCNSDDHDLHSQDCPNFNFRKIKLYGCTATSTCGSLSSSAYVDLKYLINSNDGASRITQRFRIPALTQSNGIVIPDVGAVDFNFYDAGTIIETAHLPESNYASATPTPYLKLLNGNNDANAYLATADGNSSTATAVPTGSTLPGNFSIATISDQTATGGFSVVWNASTGTSGYSILTTTTAGGTYNPIYTTTDPTVVSANISIGTSGLTLGVPNFIALRATNSAGSTTTASMTIIPLSPSYLPTITATGGVVSISNLFTIGADTYDVRYGGNPGNYASITGGYTINSTNNGSTNITPTGFTLYYFQITASNGAHGKTTYFTPTGSPVVP